MPNYFPKIPFFISIAFFVFSIAFFLLFLGKINSYNEESQLKEMNWQSEAGKREEIKVLNNSIKAIEVEKARLENHFAKSSDIVPFLDTIEELALKASAKAEVTSVDILEDGAGLSVGMKASGTWSAIYKFITLLENSPYELEFIGVDIKKETATGSSREGAMSTKWNAIFRIKLVSFTN